MEKEVVELVLQKSKDNLQRERAVATGIGIFIAVMNDKGILLRRRLQSENQSLVSSRATNLAGKWELPGGGVDIGDLTTTRYQDTIYQCAILECMRRELSEETGLQLNDQRLRNDQGVKIINLFPAWLYKPEEGIIDLAFVVALRHGKQTEETEEFTQKINSGKIRFFSIVEIDRPDVEIISKRMRHLINLSFWL